MDRVLVYSHHIPSIIHGRIIAVAASLSCRPPPLRIRWMKRTMLLPLFVFRGPNLGAPDIEPSEGYSCQAYTRINIKKEPDVSFFAEFIRDLSHQPWLYMRLPQHCVLFSFFQDAGTKRMKN